MSTTVRAGIAVTLLAGFYLVAFGIVGALAGVSLWLWSTAPGPAAGKLSLITVVVGVAIVAALWSVIRAPATEPPGVPLSADRAPDLWAAVRAIAAEVGTREPDEIRLVPDVNAAVSEDAGLLGLRPGRRYLYLGVPLVQALDVDQVRSILAHELGHYSHSHTRLGELNYRGRMTVLGTIARVGPRSVPGWILRGYARLYFLVESAVSRRQEYEADRASVRLAGREAATGALRELPVLDAAWDFYVNNYVGWGWERGYAPRDLLGGFPDLLAGRAGELAKLRTGEPRQQSSRYDSHPPIAARIAVMMELEDPPRTPDTRPATVLVPDLPALARQLDAMVPDLGGREVLDWPEFTAAAARAVDQQEADGLFRAAVRLGGRGDLAGVLDLLAAGRAPDLAPLIDPGAPAPRVMSAAVTAAIRLAAVSSGAARWRHSWSGPVALVGADGEPLNLAPVARQALDPGTTGEACKRLAELGIDPSAAAQVDATATATGAELLGGLSGMKVGDQKYDVLVLDRGLVLVPLEGKDNEGRRRMLAMLRATAYTELAARHRFLPFEEVRQARITRNVPVRVELTLHDGTAVSLHETWGGEELAKDSRTSLVNALGPYLVEAP